MLRMLKRITNLRHVHDYSYAALLLLLGKQTPQGRWFELGGLA